MKIKLIPEYASWESTLKCDLRCSHCGLEAGKPRPHELNTKEAKKLLTELNQIGIRHLVISGGEFTTRQDWLELTEFSLKQQFESVRIITSGRLEKQFVPLLHQLNNLERLVISLSLDGGPKIHDQRRGHGSFEKVISILKTPTIIPKTIITTVAKDNLTDLVKILSICLKYKVALWSIQLTLPAGRMPKENFLGGKLIKFLANLIYDWQNLFGANLKIVPDDCFDYLHKMRKNEPWQGCHAGKRLIAILSDGSVTGCPTLLDNICGNIRKNSLEEILQGNRMSDLKSYMPLECQKCRQCSGGCKTIDKVFGKQFCFKLK